MINQGQLYREMTRVYTWGPHALKGLHLEFNTVDTALKFLLMFLWICILSVKLTGTRPYLKGLELQLTLEPSSCYLPRLGFQLPTPPNSGSSDSDRLPHPLPNDWWYFSSPACIWRQGQKSLSWTHPRLIPQTHGVGYGNCHPLPRLGSPVWMQWFSNPPLSRYHVCPSAEV